MRGVAILASILISVVAALGAASRNVSLILQPSVVTGGSGTIAIASAGPPCVPPSGVCDLDRDGKMDLAVANYDTNDVSVLWGNGDGTFTPGASTFSVGSNPYGESPVAIAIADVNGDGNLDIITANESANTVTVLLNQGPGTRAFAAAKESPTGMYPEAVAVGDFNGDGKLDVATADSWDDTVTVLLGNKDGTFSILSVCSNAPTQSCHSSSDCLPGGTCDAQPIPVDVGPWALVAVDLDHNGILDLVVANSGGGPDGNGSLTVLKGLGNGAFACVAGTDLSCSAPEITSSTFDDPVAIAVGQGLTDLNGDQNPDLVVVNDNDDTLSVLLGNGNLTFQDATALYLSDSSYPEGAVVADLNGDGIPDIASSASFLDKVSVFVGLGNGNFAAPVDFALPEYSNPWGITAGDFNGDGTPDLGVADSTDPGIVSVLLNATRCVGDCGETGVVDVADILTAVNIALGNLPVAACQAGDANGDGQITVDEILTAVNNALNGCSA